MKNIAHIYTEPASYTMDLIENIDKKLGIKYYFLKNNSWYNDKNKPFKKISIFDIVKIIFSKKVIIINGYINFPFLIFFILRVLKLRSYVLGIESDTHSNYSKKSKIRVLIKRFIFSREFIYGLAGGNKGHVDYFTVNGMKKDRVFTFPMVVNHIKFKKNILPINEKVRYFFVGNFVYRKNIEFLLKSFISAHSHSSKIELYLIGNGYLYNTLYKKYSTYNFINFKGKINNADLSSHIKDFHYLILPSLSEPWGLVVNESFCNGKLVLPSKDIGCINNFKDHIKDWMIFDPLDEDSLVKTILQSINHTNYMDNANDAYNYITKEWNYALYEKI